MNFSTMNKQRKFVLIASVIGIISMFLPWYSISLLGYTQSVNGMHGWGVLAFICFIVCGGLAYLGDQTKNLDKNMWLVVLVAGLIALIIAITEFFNASNSIMGSSFVGFGLYISGIAAIVVLASAYMFRAPTDNLKDSLESMKKNIENKMNTPNTGNNSGNTNPPA
jgi:peptidoglycan/LPS O-acetylase OafA/YrhL